MTERGAGDARRGRTTSVVCGVLLLVAVAFGSLASRGPTPLLNATTPIVDGIAATGAALHSLPSTVPPTAGKIAVLLSAAALVFFWRRGEVARERTTLGAALVCAGTAQSLLLQERVASGVVLYTGAAVLYAATLRSVEPDRDTNASSPIAIVALLALFLAVGLYSLDVAPPVYYDEIGYGLAARMQGGALEVGQVLIYPFERFQAQMIPLSLHTLALSILEPRIVSLRLVSLCAGAVSLLVAAAVVRRHAGSGAALLTLALGSVSALHLTYSRAGLYIIISVLHSVLCIAALMSLLRHWNLPRACLTGGLLGASLFLYQLSWFVPILCGIVLLLSTERWRGPHGLRITAAVGVSALSVASLGPLLVPEGLAAVASQTFDYRALWNQDETVPAGAEAGRLAVPPRDIAPQELAREERDLAESGISIERLEGQRRRSFFLEGSHEALQRESRRLESDGWTLVEVGTGDTQPWTRLREVLARLFYAHGPESNYREVPAPILNPLLAPLFVLGLAHTLRARRQTLPRVLLVWCVLGLVVPSVVGGVLPRRCVLALPWIYAVMAFPLQRIARALAGAGEGRRAFAATAFLAFAVAAPSGIYAAYRLWDAPLPGELASRLRLSKIFNGLPADRPVLMPRLYREMGVFHTQLEARPLGPRPALLTVLGQPHPPPRRIRALSCRTDPPFTWIARDRPEERARYGALSADFDTRTEARDGYLIVHIEGRRPGGCAR